MMSKDLNITVTVSGDRITRDNLNMTIAKLVALRGTCRRGQVGCIIVSADGRIISMGYNGTLKGAPHCRDLNCDLNAKCQHSVHAEANAIVWAAKSGIGLSGCIMYCTTAPCYNCAQLIIQAGIYHVVYDKQYTDSLGLNLLHDNNILLTKHE